MRLSIALTAVLFVSAAPPDTSPSALERAPDGWKDLIAAAGPNLNGWSRLPIPPGSTPKGTGKGSQWSIDAQSGSLVCRGDGGHEWLRWDDEVGDAVFHVEWRFIPVAGKKGYNSGIYIRNSADAKIWHQAQTGDASGGFLFGDSPADGKLVRFNLSKQVNDQRVKPAGEWNTFELTSKGNQISLWVNGAVTCNFDACKVPKGHVGLEAEGWKIEFRNVKLKSLRD